MSEVGTLNGQVELHAPPKKPEYGVPQEVARGVYLLRMPLPFRLDHINLYVLDDPSGWILVDCGLNTPDTIALWENLFADFLRGKPVIRIVVTHLHPDHLGLAAWLHSKTKAPVYMTPGEWQMANDVFNLPVTATASIRKHYQQFGLTGEGLDTLVKQTSGYRKLVKVLPEKVEHLHGGEVLTIGGRHWQVLIGHGHSPECACLWDDAEKILIAGDHVLPTISPNINLLYVGSRRPLGDYLTSLEEFKRLECALLLPAHGSPTEKLRARITELQDHHARHLSELEAFCTEPRHVIDCVPLLFRAELPAHQLYFAVGEAAAHLVHLVEQGRLKMEGDTVWRFSKP